MSKSLNQSGNSTPVNLLVTVDASDGSFQNSTVDTDIPDNVSTNLNIYQTRDSGSSSNSDSLSDSSDSDSGTSNFPGSNGSANTAQDPSKTNVINKNVTGVGIRHGNIQDAEITEELFNNQVKNHVKGCKE